MKPMRRGFARLAISPNRNIVWFPRSPLQQVVGFLVFLGRDQHNS